MRNSQGVSFFWPQIDLGLTWCDVALNRYPPEVICHSYKKSQSWGL